MAIKTIFLDRDGVINKEINYLYKIDDFEFIEGIFDACLFFQNLNYEIVVITNQSGIARGFYSDKDYHILNEWMIEQFQAKDITILDSFYCPHSPNSPCNCRKPKPGMILEASKKHNIDLSMSWMIGDKETDIEAANLAEINNTILVKSGHAIDETNSNAKFIIDSIRDSIKLIK